MRSRHYIDEIGMPSLERPVSKPVAFIALAVIGAVASCLVRQAAAFKPAQQAAVEQSAPPATTHR